VGGPNCNQMLGLTLAIAWRIWEKPSKNKHPQNRKQHCYPSDHDIQYTSILYGYVLEMW
jgi:hypothetical protein